MLVECSLAVNTKALILTTSVVSERGDVVTAHRKVNTFQDVIEAQFTGADLLSTLVTLGWDFDPENYDFTVPNAHLLQRVGNNVLAAKLRLFMDAYLKLSPCVNTCDDFWEVR